MKSLQIILALHLVVSGYVQAIVNGTDVSAEDWRSVVLLEFSDDPSKTCTAVIVSELYAVTSAGCVLNEKSGASVTKVKVCIGQKRPFKGNNETCIEANKIYSHYNYINNSSNSAAYNIAYIKFNKALNLQQLNIKPATLITPEEFSNFVTLSKFPEITWVGFDGKNLTKPIHGVKQQGTVTGAEFDYQNLTIRISSTNTRPGSKFQGMASFIRTKKGEWRLLGLVSQSNPDNIVIYYPEINPCDEDPILVRYPQPIMQVSTVITAYPVAACGMSDFFSAEGFDELSCKKLLLRDLNWSLAIESANPVALRQQALLLYKNSKSVDDAGDIYKLLYLAQKAGDDRATIILSDFLREGKLFTKDETAARQLINVLIQKNDPSASLLLAKIMLYPRGNTELEASSDETDKTIFSLLNNAANAGLMDAQYLLARLYQLGIGTTKNHKMAYRWYAMAAMQGHADGQYQLAMQWNDGRGVRAYPEVAQFWIRQAAAQGQLDAQNRLGLLKPVAK